MNWRLANDGPIIRIPHRPGLVTESEAAVLSSVVCMIQ